MTTLRVSAIELCDIAALFDVLFGDKESPKSLETYRCSIGVLWGRWRWGHYRWYKEGLFKWLNPPAPCPFCSSYSPSKTGSFPQGTLFSRLESFAFRVRLEEPRAGATRGPQSLYLGSAGAQGTPFVPLRLQRQTHRRDPPTSKYGAGRKSLYYKLQYLHLQTFQKKLGWSPLIITSFFVLTINY